MRLIGSARRTGPGPRPSPPRPSEAAQVADNIESYARKLVEDSDKINGFLDEAPLLKTELSPTVAGSQEIIRKFTSSIFEMASILRQVSENIQNDASIGPFIAQQNNDLASGFDEYSQWLEDSIKKIEQKTREIRGWR
jgi:methyl-accepting chemotaxis protein